jgi:hypothetical protein
VLDTSPPIANPILGARPDFYDTYRHLVSDTIASLHEDPAGQQLLNLFHVDQLIPYEPGHLVGLEALLERSQTAFEPDHAR